MPISQTLFRRTNILLLAAGVAALLMIVATSLFLTAATERNFKEVVAARLVRSASADLLSLVQDAETGQRGFLLTRDRAYLTPYSAAVAELDGSVAELGNAVKDLPEVSSYLERISTRLREKFAELGSTVALGERGAFDQALRIVSEGSGKRLMDELRGDFESILQVSESRLQSAVSGQETAVMRLRWATIIGAIVILGLAAAATWTILAYTQELTAARLEVEQLNTGLEVRVRERTDALVKANGEIQRFAYIVTHDLRAPLVNIMGFTSELETTFKPIQDYIAAEDKAGLQAEAELAVTTDVPEALGFIRSSTRKMDGLINAILKISREGNRALKPARIDLTTLLEASASALHHQATAEGGGITIESQAGSIVSDRFSLDQILGNLLDNAIKYRSPDRAIAITARTRRERNGWVTIEIEDNGRGIAASDHERVFELFRRSGSQNTPGEGIGLAHVRTLARNLGGDITVRSDLGAGTTFTLSLPPDLSTVKRSTLS